MLRKRFVTFIYERTAQHVRATTHKPMHTHVSQHTVSKKPVHEKPHVHGTCELCALKIQLVLLMSVHVGKAPPARLVAASPACTEDGRRICNVKNGRQSAA